MPQIRANWGTLARRRAYSEVMKKILFLSLTLLPVAHAQGTNAIPATPAPITQPSVSQPPVLQPPVSPAPAAPSTAPARLKLSAPVGTNVELRSVTTSRLTVANVQVSARPGGQVTPAQLEEVRRSLQQGISAMNSAGTTTVNGKVFFKVASRDAAGNTTLVSSVVQALPAIPGSPSFSKAQNLTLRVTQSVAPDGKLTGLKIDSDQPQMNAMLKTLTPAKLQQLSKDLSGNSATLYSVPLQVGQPHSVTLSLDMQDLMKSLVGAFAGQEAGQLFQNFKSSPLTVTTTTTYQGLNAAGQHVFDTSSQYAAWQFSLTSQDARMPMTIRAELLKVQSGGTSAYTPAGLPVTLSQKTNMSMKMTMDIEDVRVNLTMNIEQGQSMQPR